MKRTWFLPARPRTAKRATTSQDGAGPRTTKRTRAGAESVKVILAAVLRVPLRRTRGDVARSRATRAGPAGLDTAARVVEEELPNVLGDPIGGGGAVGLGWAGAGAGADAGVAGAPADGGVTTGGVGAETDGGVTRGAAGGGGRGAGSGAGGVVGVGSVTVGSDTVIGGRPTSPRARAESVPAVAAAQKKTIVRARVERRIT